MGKETACQIVLETSQALWDILSPIVVQAPTTEDWKAIEDKFATIWNFPNCVSAIDGKHVVCQAPQNSGSMFFNYKKTFSVVLLAVVDAENNFVIVDVGSYGKNSDAAIFSNAQFGRKFMNGTLNIPPVKCLPDTADSMPHVFVGDEAFPLDYNLMRPYPAEQARNNDEIQIYNYRLSRARRIVECAFPRNFDAEVRHIFQKNSFRA